MKPRPADTGEPLAGRLERLERELQEADRRYNDALTALDRSIAPPPAVPDAPAPADRARLDELNQRFDLLAGGPPPIDRSLKGRLRGFVWRLVAPPLERQRDFNAALVDHLNRTAATLDAQCEATAALVDACRDHMGAIARFQSHLIQYLQTITAYIDTRMRSASAAADLFNASLDAVSDNLQKRWASLEARAARADAEAAASRGAIDEVRAAAALAQQTALSLKREVERLVGQLQARADGAEAAPGAAPAPGASTPAGLPAVDLNGFRYLGFENRFRGAPEEIRRRLEAYVPLFEGRHDVLDVGCGRGEFLDVLRAAGVTARGIDINDAMVEEARARGLVADRADALEFVRALPDASLGGLFAAQVIEHLPPDYLEAFVEVAAQKIRPGGLIVLETINPACWVAFFESYIRDLTHVRPLHPETMQYMLQASGFSPVEVRYSSPVAEDGRLARLPSPPASESPALHGLVDTFNANVDRLNARMFGYQDYAVIGYR
jgi:SAM-dependent methyltransferase